MLAARPVIVCECAVTSDASSVVFEPYKFVGPYITWEFAPTLVFQLIVAELEVTPVAIFDSERTMVDDGVDVLL